MNIKRCRRLVSLEAKRKSLESELKRTTKEIEKLYEPILEDMALADVTIVPFKDGTRLQPYKTYYCNKKAGVYKPAMVEALKSCGLGAAVDISYLPSVIKERLREREEEILEDGGVPDPNELLPEELRPFFNVTEGQKVVVYGLPGSK